MATAVLTLHLRLPEVHSLKEKRSALRPVLARLHKEYNVSAAEIDLQDHWQEAIIACAMVGNDRVFLEQALLNLKDFTARMWPDLPILDEHLEIW